MIDLRSDTVTKPDEAMRAAMRDAEVGDDVHRGDPTVAELERRTSEVLGTDAALFCPSGTMANQIAIAGWTDPGQELLLERTCHIFKYELGGASWLSGVQTRPIDGGERGLPAPARLAEAIQTESLHVAGTGLIALENTHNNRGGRAHTVDDIAAATAVGAEHEIPIHLDGARLWNAAVATDTDPAAFAAVVDSVMVSLSKGLGAPVGSMLAGPEAFIERGRRMRKAFGGGMRQAGVLAAPALLALERRDELAADHALARQLAEGIDDLEGLTVVHPETNIVVVEVDAALATVSDWLAACEAAGVRGSDVGPDRVRYVTHRDVDSGDIEAAIEGVRAAHEALG